MRGKHAHAFRTAEHTRLIPASAGKTAWVLRPRNPGTAHPSVCRESATAWTEEDCAHDSSPRVRGKQINLQVQAPCPGLIPACAGKTRRLLAWLPASWAHPRVCGENAPSTTATKAAHGSSPRVRGKQRRSRRRRGGPGLIPACAGKTEFRKCARSESWAHPRVCGENRDAHKTATAYMGSSPRVRGKLMMRSGFQFVRGLIPACAGKTRCLGRVPVLRRAHPRVCGENRRNEMFRWCTPGSSPRVRGKHEYEQKTSWEDRLIPACAGKTCHQHLGRSRARAHPRVCGENLGIESRLRIFCGSSPRVRGKLSETPYRSIGSRLIPACAGKTATKSRSPARCQAHPRVCGENSNLRCLIFVESGSSPRVRGKLHRPTRKGQTPGLIPACAGKT